MSAEDSQNITDFYEIHGTIAKDNFSKTKRGRHLLTGEKVAVKIIDGNSQQLSFAHVKKDVEAMKRLNHQHVCQLYHIMQTNMIIFMVLDYCPGGDLLDYLVEKNHLSEEEARKLFRQIVSAVAYIHNQGLVHRNIKMENIFLDRNNVLKLTDCVLCAELKGDIWSIGVILHLLLCGSLPYYFSLREEGHTFSNLSQECKEIVSEMLQVDPRKRITARGLLSHPWVMKGYSEAVQWESTTSLHPLDEDCVTELTIYYRQSREYIRQLVSQWKYDQTTATYLLLRLRKARGKPIELKDPRSEEQAAAAHPSGCQNPSEAGEIVAGEAAGSILAPVPPEEEKMRSEKTPTDDTPVDSTIFRESAAMKAEQDADKSSERGKTKVCFAASGVVRTSSELHEMSVLSSAFNVNDNWASIPNPCCTAAEMSRDEGPSSASSLSGVSSDSSTTVPERGKKKRKAAVLQSLQKGLDKTFSKLASKSKKWRGQIRPRRLKHHCNVTTTQLLEPAQVLQDVKTILSEKHVDYTVDNWTLKCQTRSDFGKGETVFELEICQLKNSDMLGIRRQRIKGDAWVYKQLMEEILSAFSE